LPHYLDFEKIGIKQYSSFIEWTASTYFSDINTILQTYIRIGNIDIIRNSNGNDYLGVTIIRTCHYLNTDYKAIFTRRIMRFIEQVKQSEELLFVRDDVLDTITSDEINEFKNIINPISKYNILIVSKNINNDIISMKNVTNKIYNVDNYIDYIQEITNTPIEFTNLKANDKD
jgi:hypothetical protein